MQAREMPGNRIINLSDRRSLARFMPCGGKKPYRAAPPRIDLYPSGFQWKPPSLDIPGLGPRDIVVTSHGTCASQLTGYIMMILPVIITLSTQNGIGKVNLPMTDLGDSDFLEAVRHWFLTSSLRPNEKYRTLNIVVLPIK